MHGAVQMGVAPRMQAQLVTRSDVGAAVLQASGADMALALTGTGVDASNKTIFS